MNQPLVSVILPAYNAGKTIGAAVSSILDQDYTNIELIIIDDGSSDNTAEAVRSFSDPRIKLFIHSSNEKLINTLNEGLQIASGKYIARMDADDISYPSRIGKQVAYMEAHTAVGICGTGIRLTGNTDKISLPETESNRIKARLLFDNCFNHPTVMFRSDFVKQHAVHYSSEYPHAEDYALWCEICNKTEFGNIIEVLLDYYVGPGQVSQRHRPEQIASIRKAQHILLSRIQLNISERESELLEQLFTKECPAEKTFFTDAAQLLEKVAAANEKTGVLPVKEFSEHIGKTWFQVCSRYASKATASRKTYLGSSLKNLYLPPFKNRVFFLLKSLVR